ncbi:selenium metabolism-associated LysR family transcriptional regulator [Caldalkalibacillus thermarum]|uniref:selenium metabolism-associated LysR family transcriptional regulator n=1 Tax=Caldalkalibacillus thermarum TaxID=296745 RepID=UPI001669CB22|nr:selenium metabolism-associated LysR family transcriptional regulator [Caldalkalibacillus thermarum]
MNLKRVKTFMLAAEHKNFSTVAQILNISQPAVSKQIKKLEKELGVPLLNRDTLEPTEAGRIVLRHGETLLKGWQEIVEQCAALQGNMAGLIKIGASTIPGTYLLPPILQKFLDRFPQMEVQLAVHESTHVLELITNEKVDIGFVGISPADESLKQHVIAKDKLVIIGPDHGEEIEDFEDIKDSPFVFRSERSGTWRAADQGLRKWGYSVRDLKCVAKVEHTESVISMVQAGLGYSIVSNIAARAAVQAKRVKILAELPIEREFYAVYLPAKENNQAITHLVDLASILSDGFKTH